MRTPRNDARPHIARGIWRSSYRRRLSRLVLLLAIALLLSLPNNMGAMGAPHRTAARLQGMRGLAQASVALGSLASPSNISPAGAGGWDPIGSGCPTSTPTPTAPATVTVTPTLTDTPVPTTVPVTTPNSVAFGVNDHPMWHSLATANSDFDRMKAAGLIMARIDVDWDKLEPAPNTWSATELGKLDSIIAAMDAHGITGIFTLLYTPAWARDNLGSNLTPPINPDDYGNAAGYLAARYASHPNMVWEIWNEPDDLHFWNTNDCADPEFYTSMLQSAYTRIKAADPAAIVLGGSIVFNNEAYLDRMYAAGAQGYFDALSLHPYCICAPNSTQLDHYSFPLTVEGMEADMASHGEPNKPIWITEVGWSTNVVSDTLRATFLQQAAAMSREWPFVKAYSAYVLNQDDNSQFGLIAPDGTATESWNAFAQAAQPPALASSPPIVTCYAPLSVSGANFGASEPVNLYWDSVVTPALTTTTSITGSFAATMSVPVAISGTHTLRAVGQSSAIAQTTMVTITPRLFVTPPSAPPGGAIHLLGCGFGAQEPVRLYWDAPLQQAGTTASDTTGSFYGSTSVTVAVPLSAAPGPHHLYGVGQITHAIGSGNVTVH